MEEGSKIRLLVNSRYYPAGAIGLVVRESEDSNGFISMVDMAWEEERNHYIFIRDTHEGELWERVDEVALITKLINQYYN